MADHTDTQIEAIITTIHPPIRTIELKLVGISDEDYMRLLSSAQVKLIPDPDVDLFRTDMQGDRS